VQQKVMAISSWCIAPARPNNIAAMIVEGTMICKKQYYIDNFNSQGFKVGGYEYSSCSRDWRRFLAGVEGAPARPWCM
jgi:hypothetical protein